MTEPVEQPIVARTERRLHLDGVDAFGIVYYARYWDWYEHTFEQLLSDLGHPLAELLGEGIGFPAVHAEIDYTTAALLGDLVRCELRPVGAGGRSLRLRARFSNGDGEQLAVASTVHVATRRDRTPAALPDWLRAAADGADRAADGGPDRLTDTARPRAGSGGAETGG